MPSSAVRFAILLQARFRELTQGAEVAIQERIGIHLGELVIAEHETASKVKDLYGIELATCSRVMSVAQGGQILLTRGVFDSARQVLKGEDIPGVGPLNWVSHGPYLLKGIEEPVEVCEVGEVGQRSFELPKTSEKARRVEAVEGEAVLGWRPAVGQEVPNTPWMLEQKLGEGGFGEVWVAQHRKLKERRVFKFCFRADRVRALKREMTLFRLLNLQVNGPSSSSGGGQPLSEADKVMGDFVSVVLADLEDVWQARFQQMGEEYREPQFVLFTDQVDSACGYAGATSGPFYCPGDMKIYLDLSFFEEMQRKLGAPGDFALAYVIAHEFGHHIQNLRGVNNQVMSRRGQLSGQEWNQLMVRMELQADFLAGVWAHHARQAADFLERGDLEEGINAAAAVGDDRIQRQSQGYIVPDAFTHGTSEQRVRWFKKGLETGDIRQGYTFSAKRL